LISKTSASTCAKSGLMAKSAVIFGDGLYRISPPILYVKDGSRSMVSVLPATAYGLNSNVLPDFIFFMFSIIPQLRHAGGIIPFRQMRFPLTP
jgi:hypothetical protein